MPETEQPPVSPDNHREAEVRMPNRPIHAKLLAAGITQEQLEKMGVGAILCQTCPDCESEIFYTLTHEYYAAWKKQEPVPMVLMCTGCKTYKWNLKVEEGEVLFEQEGTPEKREVIPMSEKLPSLPV